MSCRAHPRETCGFEVKNGPKSTGNLWFFSRRPTGNLWFSSQKARETCGIIGIRLTGNLWFLGSKVSGNLWFSSRKARETCGYSAKKSVLHTAPDDVFYQSIIYLKDIYKKQQIRTSPEKPEDPDCPGPTGPRSSLRFRPLPSTAISKDRINLVTLQNFIQNLCNSNPEMVL